MRAQASWFTFTGTVFECPPDQEGFVLA